MAGAFIEIGLFALVAGLLFRYPHIGMLVHPDGSHPRRRHERIRSFRNTFKLTAQSFLAAGAGLLALGFALF